MTVTDRRPPRARTRESKRLDAAIRRHLSRSHFVWLSPNSTLALETRKRHGAAEVSGRPFADIEGHSCRECVTADAVAQRAPLAPIAAWLLLIFLAGTFVGAWLALSATSSLTPGRVAPVGMVAGATGIPQPAIDDVAVTTIPIRTAAAAAELADEDATQSARANPAERSMSREGGPQGGRFIGSKDSGTAGPSGGPNTPLATTAVTVLA